jgi:hypothetical protein
MYNIRKLSSGNVIVMTLSGKLTRADYAEIVPFVAGLIRKYKKVRLLIELDNFEGWTMGATFDDIIFIFRYGFHVERIAFLVHAAQDKLAVLLDRPFGRALSKNVKYFRHKFCEDAWAWICDGAVGVVDEVFPRHGVQDGQG